MPDRYYRIISRLKAVTGFTWAIEYKDSHGKIKNRPERVTIPGAYRPDDIDPPEGEKSRIPPTFITGKQLTELCKPGHEGKPSAFSQVKKTGEEGGKGILIQKCEFSEMPEKFQKKFEPEKFVKLQKKTKNKDEV